MACPRCGRPMAEEQTYCGQCGLTPDIEADPAAVEMVGRVLDGRYRLEYLIGIGGMGAIFRAEVVGPGHTVAVKVLHPAYSVDPVSRKRLENEARLASQIDHPNIVSIYDFRTSASMTYLVMEYLSGQSLAEVLGNIGYLGVRRTVHITRQLLSALEAAYRVEVLHRDLKPENIFLITGPDQLDYVKVLDFGMAMVSHGPRITNDGRICGTPAYMSPEQARGQTLDHRSDLYAVGVVLYECLTAVNPFLGESAPDTLVNQVTREATPPSTVRQEARIPPYLDALVMRSLRKSPQDRFQTATEFRQVLEGLVLAGRAPRAVGDQAPRVESSLVTCSECGRPVAKDAERCNACGQLLSRESRLDGPLEDLLSPELISALHASREAQDSATNLLRLDATSAITACPTIGNEPQMVGMAREQQEIAEIFDRADAHVLRLLGAPGTGKGRLARDGFRVAMRRNWRAIWLEPEGVGVASGMHGVLEPVRDASRRLLGVDGDLREEEGLLDAAARAGFPMEQRQGLLELFGLVSSTDPADDRRARRAGAWRALVQAAARRTPVLLVFRDLDRMDAPTQELVAALAALPDLPTHPLRVFVTQDPGLMLLWPKTTTWAIPPLSQDDALTLARALLAEARIDGDPARIAAASRGVPLMIVELVRLLALEGEGPMPRGLAEVINRRLSRLPSRPRSIVHALAVLGRPALPPVLSELIGEPADAGALTLLGRHGFLAPTGDGWCMAHRVNADVAYASTPAAVRAALHRKAAELARRDDASAAQIATHLVAGGEGQAAIPYLLRAGWEALDSLDDVQAAARFNRVLQLVPAPRADVGDREPWVAANVGLSSALTDGGDRETALQLLRRAVRSATEAGWKAEAVRLEGHQHKLGGSR